MRNLILGGTTVLVLTFCVFAAYYRFTTDHLKETVEFQKQESKEEKNKAAATNPERAAEWRADAWRNENGEVSKHGLANAVAQRGAYLAAHNPPHGFGDKGIAEMSWLPVGPQNVGGRTRSVVFDPTAIARGDTVWAGAASGGVWKSVIGASDRVTWTAMNGDLQNFAINTMLLDVDPAPPYQKTLWAGTGEGFASPGLAGGGLFKSTNGGESWSVISQSGPISPGRKWQYIDSLALTRWTNPDTNENETVMLAGVENDPGVFPLERGIMRSTNGVDWEQVYPAVTSFSIVFDPSNPGHVVAEVRQPTNEEGDDLPINRVVYSTRAGERGSWVTATRTYNNSPTPTPTPTNTWTPSSTPTASPSPPPTVPSTPALAPTATPADFETGAADRIVKLWYHNSNLIYAQEVDASDNFRSQISISTDGGRSFTTEGRTGIETFRAYCGLFWVSPFDPDLIITGGTNLYRSTNGGRTFGVIAGSTVIPSNEPHSDSQYAFHPPTSTASNERLYLTNDGGIWKADNIRTAAGSNGWQNLNSTYQTTQFFTATGMVGTSAAPGIIFGGTQDNGSLRVTETNPNAANLIGGDGMSTVVDGNYCYGELGFVPGWLYRISDCNSPNPTQQFGIWQGISDYYFGAVDFPDIIVDQTNENRFFFGGSSVWRSDNIRELNADNVRWTEIKENPVLIASPTGSQTPYSYKPVRITAMDVNPSDQNVMWVAELDVIPPGYHANIGRLYYTREALMLRPSPSPTGYPYPTPQWFRVDDVGPPNNHLPDRQILEILIDKADPNPGNTVYVGFGGQNEKNLWVTNNAGGQASAITWREITGDDLACEASGSLQGLPCLPINTIAIDPNNRAKIYVGTDIGLYKTDNVNATNPEWQPVMTGPANVKISDLNFLKNPRDANGIMTDSKILLAATYGRGLWTANLNPSATPKVTINDFDGDGRSDVAVVRDDGTHLNWHRQGSSDGYNAAQFGAAGDQVAPADYDGDGKTDMSVFRPSESRWYSLLSSSNTLATTDLGNENSEKVPADYDGDSLSDKAAFDKFSGTWEVERTENGNLTFVWGAEGDKPVSIDIDGDEKADYGVLHEVNGVITLSVKTEAGAEFHKQFGLEGDVAVPGEYDGDHKIDLAVWRPDDDGEGNGCWYIVHAADGWTEVTDIPWGENGDIPVPGDYDGDDKFDIAVWRPSTGIWHLLQSSNGYYSELFGADGDKPVGIKAVYNARPSGRPFTRVPPNAVPRRRTFQTDVRGATSAD